ncbi:MAG: hypothetical protein D6822_04360 [Cyanobacteria bacterium J149]|nr:MAG: hypothetical protein D6822_04360 [Cyanobacteria bacterium J149]
MPQIGRTRAVGIGKETTWGTAVSPSYWLPLTDIDYKNKIEAVVKEGMRARIEATYGHDVAKQWAEGSLGGNVFSESFGLLLYGTLGSVSTASNADPSGNVYDHTFTVSNSNSHPSLTIGVDDTEIGDKNFAGATLNSLELQMERENYVKFSADFIGKASASATLTPSFGTEYLLRPQDVTFKHASDSSGLGAASATAVQSMTLTIEKNAESNFNLGSTDPSRVYNKQFAVTLKVDLLYTDDTLHDYWKAGTSRAVEITITNTDQVIGTSANPSLDIILYSGQIVEWENSGGIDDIQTQTLTFRADYSASDSKMIQAVLTNLVTSY